MRESWNKRDFAGLVKNAAEVLVYTAQPQPPASQEQPAPNRTTKPRNQQHPAESATQIS